MSNGNSGENNSGKMVCGYCLLTTGGGTRTPALTIVNGQAVCERHLEEAVENRKPEVGTTPA